LSSASWYSSIEFKSLLRLNGIVNWYWVTLGIEFELVYSLFTLNLQFPFTLILLFKLYSLFFLIYFFLKFSIEKLHIHVYLILCVLMHLCHAFSCLEVGTSFLCHEGEMYKKAKCIRKLLFNYVSANYVVTCKFLFLGIECWKWCSITDWCKKIKRERQD